MYTILQSYLNAFFDVYDMMGLLATVVVLGLYKRSNKSIIFLYIYLGMVIGLSMYNPIFASLIGIVAYLGVYHQSIIVILVSTSIFAIVSPMSVLGIYFLSAFIGYMASSKDNIEQVNKENEDTSRKNIYELETAKAKLKYSQIDLINITELNERNRIARSIHDNLGHKLIGSKLLLEAAVAISKTDSSKSTTLVSRVVNELTESVDLLRDTVHDLKPNKDIGMSHIKNTINRFNFCEIDFETSGDLNDISSGLFAVIELNLKEALTNVSKFSTANKVEVKIENTPKYTRFSITDNGAGINYINEGLGLSGMRERVENIGGTFTIDYDDGFKLFMFFPKRS
jgi:signal transduction histidine kinase